jgi:glycosyltransferase involved in cell wall biosynthesis
LVLLFVDHPNPETTPLSTASLVRRRAEDRGWLGSTVRFEGWRPFDRRFELPMVADLAVVTHRPGLETDLSLRTRLVDLLWLGLPVVATAGGTMSRVIDDIGAGATVAAGDSAAVTASVRRLLGDEGWRRRAGAAGREWAHGRSWASVSRPLLEFAADPRRDPHRGRFVGLAPEATSAEEPVMRRVMRMLRRLGGDR